MKRFSLKTGSSAMKRLDASMKKMGTTCNTLPASGLGKKLKTKAALNAGTGKRSYPKIKTAKTATRYLNDSYADYRELLEKRMSQLRPTRLRRATFERLSGKLPYGGDIRHSDLVARRKFAHLVRKEIRDLRRAHPRMRFFHGTLLADEGIMSDRRPYLDLDRIHRKATKAIRALDCNGIAAIEIQALTNWPQKGRGRTLIAHVHCILWYDPKFDRRSWDHYNIDAELRGHRWTSRFGADPVSVVEITDQIGCPSFWASYVFKAPSKAKRRVPTGVSPGSHRPDWRLKPVAPEDGYRPELAMLIFEISAQLRLYNMSLGVRGGAAILSRCRSRLDEWHKLRRDNDRKISRRKAHRFFEWTRKLRRKRYHPAHIAGRTVD